MHCNANQFSGDWFGGITDCQLVLWTCERGKGSTYHQTLIWYPYVKKVTIHCFAYQILQQNRKLMDAVVDELVQKKSLTKQELLHLVELHGSLKPMPPSILDIRTAKRMKFQEMIMKQNQAAIGSNVWSARCQENHLLGFWSWSNTWARLVDVGLSHHGCIICLLVFLSHGHFLQRLCMFCPSEPIHGSYTITAGMLGRNPREFWHHTNLPFNLGQK